jgi:hypothetical protein
MRNLKGFLALLPAAALFLGCTDSNVGSHILTQPYTKEQYFFPGKDTDPSGRPLPDVAVDMGFLLMGMNQTSPFPKPHVSYLYTVYLTVEVFDIFDDPVKTILDTMYCTDDSCHWVIPYWDKTNDNNEKVPQGFYRAREHTVVWKSQTDADSSVTEEWVPLEGPIDTTDQGGGFKVPPLPWEAIPVHGGSGLVEYFKGWITLSFSKPGYVSHTDTLDIFAKMPDFVLSPAAGSKAGK